MRYEDIHWSLRLPLNTLCMIIITISAVGIGIGTVNIFTYLGTFTVLRYAFYVIVGILAVYAAGAILENFGND